ncbi:MAG TPA: NUDIX hydrolase [Allosphingosinicella sp.]|jgi:8-oxo-dGTP diphosphatase
MWHGQAFNGTKIALLCGSRIVAYRRDDKLGIPFPGLWDLPGGGREGFEGPVACALREVEEEFGISLEENRVRSLRRYRSGVDGGLDSYFCAAEVTPEEIERIRFGDEGQEWRLMEASEFLGLEDAVPNMKHRLKACLAEGAAGT